MDTGYGMTILSRRSFLLGSAAVVVSAAGPVVKIAAPTEEFFVVLLRAHRWHSHREPGVLVPDEPVFD